MAVCNWSSLAACPNKFLKETGSKRELKWLHLSTNE